MVPINTLTLSTPSSLLVRFTVYNTLQENLPPGTNVVEKMSREGLIGFAASIVSDTVSNSLRVVKTYRQVDVERVSYGKGFFSPLKAFK